MDGSEEFVQSLGGRFPAKGLSRSRIEGERDGRKDIGIMHAEIGSLGKVLAQQAVGILVRAALPGAVRVAEVDMDPGVDPQMGVLSHLRALVPGQEAAVSGSTLRPSILPTILERSISSTIWRISSLLGNPLEL